MTTRLQELKLIRKEVINDIIIYKCKNPHYNIYLHIEELEKELDYINNEIILESNKQ